MPKLAGQTLAATGLLALAPSIFAPGPVSDMTAEKPETHSFVQSSKQCIYGSHHQSTCSKAARSKSQAPPRGSHRSQACQQSGAARADPRGCKWI